MNFMELRLVERLGFCQKRNMTLAELQVVCSKATCGTFPKVCGGHREMPIDAFKTLLMERTLCDDSENSTPLRD